MSESQPLPVEIDVRSVASMLESNEDFLLLDVREPDEYETAKIEGSHLLPMSQWSERAGDLEDHRGRRIIVHCHHGGRSMQVTQALRGAGFEQVQNMAGGIDAWSQLVDPTVPRY